MINRKKTKSKMKSPTYTEEQLIESGRQLGKAVQRFLAAQREWKVPTEGLSQALKKYVGVSGSLTKEYKRMKNRDTPINKNGE